MITQIRGGSVTQNDVVNHDKYGKVQMQWNQSKGWHYIRWGCAGFGLDFENLSK